MRFSACLEFFFSELPILRRIAAVREAGLTAGELWHYRGRDLRAMRAEADACGLDLVGLCAMEPVPGLNDASAATVVRRGVLEAMDAAATLGCQKLTVLGGMTLHGIPRAEQMQRIVDSLCDLAPEAGQRGLVLVVEALNSRKSFPGYLLDNYADVLRIVREVDHPAVRVLYDVYHAEMMGEDHLRTMSGNGPWIGAVQIAGVPDRREPYLGQINGPEIVRALGAMGYQGTVGLEYLPTGDSARSLKTTLEWLRGTPGWTLPQERA